MHKLGNSDELGIEAERSFDMSRLVKRKTEVVSNLRSSLQRLLESRGVDVIPGRGCIESPGKVTVESNEDAIILDADVVIIATGSHPASIPGWEGAVSTDEIFDEPELPDSLAIIGGGTTGVELTTIFHELGSEVTLLEAMDRILPDADPEVSQACRTMLEKRGVDIFCSASVDGVTPSNNGCRISFTEGTRQGEIEVERALAVLGRSPNTVDLAPPELGLKTHGKGWIEVDSEMRTSVDGIYAVGDVVGGNLCAHTATAQGIDVAEKIMGAESTARFDLIPRYVSTIPEIAWVGLTEEEAEVEVLVGKCPTWANSRSTIGGFKDGFAKILADAESGEILGAHIISEHAVDMAMEVSLAMSSELLLEDLASATHPHPTYSEILMEAARNALGGSIHI
jgi:dihydrolipoamide dehydrogenase